MKLIHKLTLPTLALTLITAVPALAQGPNPFPPGLAKELAARASNYTEVTLDKQMLHFASQFMNKDDKGDQQARSMIHNLNAIYVRTYDFKKPGEYSAADLARIRSKFSGPEWQPMVESHSTKDHETSEVFMKVVNGETQGMLVLDAEPKELNFVYISGHINPADLGDLGGNFGVPKLHVRTPNGNSNSSSGGNQ